MSAEAAVARIPKSRRSGRFFMTCELPSAAEGDQGRAAMAINVKDRDFAGSDMARLAEP
jgi:hypothetical protein